MKITVSCAKEELYPLFREIGFDGVDIKMDKSELVGNGTETLRQKFRAAQAAGLSVMQTHLPYCPSHLPPPGDGLYRDFAAEMMPYLVRGIELTAEAGARVAVLHPYFEAEREGSRAGNLKLIRTLMPVLERTGVTLALENIYGNKRSDVYLSRAADLLYYAEYFKSPRVGICLDTGHAVILGQKPAEMLAAYGSHACALHVHTTVPGFDMHTIPGILNGGEQHQWDEFCRTLYTSGYAGTFNLEIGTKYKSSAAKEAFYRLAFAVAHEMLETAKTESCT